MYLSRVIYTSFLLLCWVTTFASTPNDRLSEKEKYKFDFLFYEAMQSRAQEQYGTTFDYLKYCYELDSTNAAVLYDLGNFYSSIDDKENALAMFKGASKYDPTNYYYVTAYGTVCLEMGILKQRLLNIHP